MNTSVSPFELAPSVDELVNERLSLGTMLTMTVATQSMRPTLIPGDRIVLARVDPVNAQLGEIVVVKRGNAWVAHRLIERQKGGMFVTKGDNTLNADPAMSQERVQSVVHAIQRNGRMRELNSPRARAAARSIARLSRMESRVNRVIPKRFSSLIRLSTSLFIYSIDVLTTEWHPVS